MVLFVLFVPQRLKVNQWNIRHSFKGWPTLSFQRKFYGLYFFQNIFLINSELVVVILFIVAADIHKQNQQQ